MMAVPFPPCTKNYRRSNLGATISASDAWPRGPNREAIAFPIGKGRRAEGWSGNISSNEL